MIPAMAYTQIGRSQSRQKKQDPIQKVKEKKGWGMTQVAEHLVSKHEVLNSKPSAIKESKANLTAHSPQR
jgi:hypothetical protein